MTDLLSVFSPEQVEVWIEAGGYVVLFALLFACGLGLPLPEDIPLLLAGYLLGENYEALYEWIRPYEYVIYGVVLLGGAYVIYRWARGRGEPGEDPEEPPQTASA